MTAEKNPEKNLTEIEVQAISMYLYDNIIRIFYHTVGQLPATCDWED